MDQSSILGSVLIKIHRVTFEMHRIANNNGTKSTDVLFPILLVTPRSLAQAIHQHLRYVFQDGWLHRRFSCISCALKTLVGLGGFDEFVAFSCGLLPHGSWIWMSILGFGKLVP